MIAWLKSWFGNPWEYGTHKGLPARRHRRHGNVQFILWEKGEQGYSYDYWHDMNSYWWPEFIPNTRGSTK